MDTTFVLNLSYLIGVLTFVFGLRLLGSPDTARKGNLLAAVGMSFSVLVTLFIPIEGASNNYLWIFGGLLIGGLIGWLTAIKVQMTAMPQLVSILNGLGGACAALLAITELIPNFQGTIQMTSAQLGIGIFALLIGLVSFSGSLLAYGKLQGLVKDSQVQLPRHNILNIVMLLTVSGLAIIISFFSGSYSLFFVFIAVTLVYGVSFVAPIGGADMPVVISLLNSMTGLSAAAAGFIYQSQLMIVGGILVGAAGTILTVLMCQAMNRSLFNVIIGGFGSSGSAAVGADTDGKTAKTITVNDMAIQMYYSQTVVFVPGYGLAVAQAQKTVKELEDLLEKNGVDVKYAIHPVAGRMPGHMNVLLAEANVPYPKLLDMDEANDILPNTDVVVVVGANDVVNPSAEDTPGSPIYGMPVLQVWNAKNVIVLKRSMSPGYAGIQNPLFFNDKTKMLFGDAKHTLADLTKEVKTL
jgi:NAD(P) transhydrogenase subunit beta